MVDIGGPSCPRHAPLKALLDLLLFVRSDFGQTSERQKSVIRTQRSPLGPSAHQKRRWVGCPGTDQIGLGSPQGVAMPSPRLAYRHLQRNQSAESALSVTFGRFKPA